MQNLNVLVTGYTAQGKSAIIKQLINTSNALNAKNQHNLKQTDKCDCTANNFDFLKDNSPQQQIIAVKARINHLLFKTSDRTYTFIEPSDYKELVTNLAGGTHQIHAAILVVDVSKPLIDQAFRYAYLLAMFGIKDIIIAVNKMDLKLYNKFKFWEVSEEIKDFIKKLDVHCIATIPVSAKYEDNITTKSSRMKWYRSHTLRQSLDVLEVFSAQQKLAQFPLRILVQRCYTIGPDTTIEGNVLSGKLFQSQGITFGPSHHTTRILSIQVSTQKRTCADPGEAVTAILNEPANIEKGQVAFNTCHPPLITDYLIADVFWAGSEPLKPTDKIDISCAAQKVSAQVIKISEIADPACVNTSFNHTDQLGEFQVGKVAVEFDSPICIDPFKQVEELGKFTLSKHGKVLGGGICK